MGDCSMKRRWAAFSRVACLRLLLIIITCPQSSRSSSQSLPIRIKSNMLERIFMGIRSKTPASRFAWRKLHVDGDALILESRLSSEALVIPRNPPTVGDGGEDLKVVRRSKKDGFLEGAKHAESLYVDGVFGLFDLPSGPYLALITDSEERYRGHGLEFRLITEINLVRVYNTTLEEGEEDKDLRQIELLKKAFKSHDLYFSTSHDVTLSSQRRALLDFRQNRLPLWKRADDRFFWNKNLLAPLMEADAHDWILPVMSAHVQVERNCTVGKNGQPFTLLLVSRRSCLRQGRRFIMRGIDKDGNVANFVETEQLVMHPNGARTSLVQVRGSIPLYWKSPADLSYTPKVKILGSVVKQAVALEKHIRELVSIYGSGPLVLVNLIDKKKDQGRLGDSLEEALSVVTPSFKKVCKVRHVWFDFHHECRKMRWGNLAKLIDIIAPDLHEQGYFYQEGRGRVRQTQRGVMRTNCMDCLDRTNVVQNLMARWSLRRQLQTVGLVVEEEEEGKDGTTTTKGTVLELPYPELEQSLRQLWTGNADAVSLLYAGTNALKRDFTKTGKRTKRGMLADGYNSAMRYVINNFEDDINQQAVDMMIWGVMHAVGGGVMDAAAVEEERDEEPEQKEFWIKALEAGGAGHRGAAYWDTPLVDVVAAKKGVDGKTDSVEEEEEDDDDEEEGEEGEQEEEGEEEEERSGGQEEGNGVMGGQSPFPDML